MYAQVVSVAVSPLLVNSGSILVMNKKKGSFISKCFSLMSAVIMFLMLISTVNGECNPSETSYYNSKNTYCSDKQEGFDQGTWLNGCISSPGLRKCQCTCHSYGLVGEYAKCKSGIDSSRDFCYNKESACTKCPHGQGLQNCGCDTNTWECGPGTCVTCPDGTFSGTGLTCTDCAVSTSGYYIDTPCFKGSPGVPGHNTIFGSCPAGFSCLYGQKYACSFAYYCEGGEKDPTACDESKAEICDSSGLSAPIIGCRAGYRLESGGQSHQCTPCNAGEYLPLGGGSSHTSSVCMQCAEGTYQDSVGGGNCKPCPPGTYSFERGATYCTPCNAGSHQTRSGQTQCDPCPAGTYMPTSSSEQECFLCPAGKYSASEGSSSCSICTGRTYSDEPGRTACLICPQDMTIYKSETSSDTNELTFDNPPYLHDSAKKCEYCPSSYFTCNCLPGQITCMINECQLNSLCAPCPQSDFYCPSKGKKYPWKVWEKGQTYVLIEGNKTNDRVLGNCLKCSEDTEYASPTCDKSNTVCKTCDLRRALITYADPACTPTSNAKFSVCNVSRGDLKPGIGVCNLCPPGSTKLSEGGCEACPRNTFSKMGGDACISCPAGTVSGGGASKCTAMCSPGNYSHSGLPENCAPLQTSGQLRVIAQWKRVTALEMGAQLANGEMIAATNNAAGGGGSLWRMGMDQAGNVYENDNENGRITAVISVPSSSFSSFQVLLMADVVNNYQGGSSLGTIRKLTYDFTVGQVTQSTILTLIPTPSSSIGQIRWPSAIQLPPSPSNENVFFVADSVQHCIFKVQLVGAQTATFSQTLWRGSIGYSSIARNVQLQLKTLNKIDWLLSRPSFMTPYPLNAEGFNDLMIVMDDIGIWTFNVNEQPSEHINSNLYHICGQGLSSSSSLLCADINFQTWGSSGMTATLDSNHDVVILVAFQTTTKSGILSFTTPASAVGGSSSSTSPLSSPIIMVVEELISSFQYNSVQQFPTSLFFGDNGKGVFVTLGGIIGQVAEVGMHACLCDAGLYCDTISKSCVQSPVGTYSPSWSSRPVSCKIGTISDGPGGKDEFSGCKRCGRSDFTTNKAGALNCEPLCPSVDQRFSALLGECVQGCNVSNGEYLDTDEMTCKVCPIGSGAVPGSIGKGITDGCPACQPPMKGSLKVPGTCEPCPFPLAAIFPGATICMPTRHEPFFADGLYLPPMALEFVVNASQGSTEINQFTLPIFDTPPTDIITSMSVNSGGLIFISTGNFVWKLNRVKQLPLSEPALVASQTSLPIFLSLIEVSDDGLTLFSTERGATCIWKSAFNEKTNVFSVEGGDQPWAGICGVPGDMNGFNGDARLGPINGLALMEVEGHTSLLFVSTSSFAHGCTSIRSISLYDGSITTFLSYDQLQSPLIVLNYCPDLFFKMSIPRGTDKLFYAYGPDIRLTEIYNENTTGVASLNYGIDSFLDFSLSRDHTVASMCSKADGTLVILEGFGGDMIIVSPRVWSTGTPLVAQTVTNIVNKNNNYEILECAGQHIWYADDSGKVYESSFSSGHASILSGCIGGFVLDSNQACMQVGIGQYSIPNSPLPLNCKSGTYGTEGGSLHVSCKECPTGSISQEGALGCQMCPPSYPYSSRDFTKCLAVCPISTYLVLQNNSRSCTACPPGFFGPEGAISIKECKPCAAGTYVNESTNGACVQCPSGWSSAAGSHMCVKVCRPGQCAADGVSCKTLTSNWEIVTSVFVPRGVFMRAIAVSRGGGVFYTDNDFIKYFLDDCPAHLTLAEAEVCSKSGVDLLPPLCSGCSRGISAMIFAQNFASDVATNQRYLYITSITTHSVYRLPILYKQGIVDIEGTQAKLASDFYDTSSSSSSPSLYSNIFSDSWLLIGSANGIAGFSDGPFLSSRFNTPSELDISADDRFLIISDFFNHRIRIADLQTNKVSTILGTGTPCWNVGSTSACSQGGSSASSTDQCKYSSCASANLPIGTGLSPDGSTLYVTMNQENAVGSLSNPLIAEENHEFSIMCRLIFNQIPNPTETCQTWTAGSKSCMLYKPYDVLVSGNSMYVCVTDGITKIDLDSGTCQQIGGSFWDFNPKTSRGLKDGEINPQFNTSDARMNQPFRMALATDRGILYIADMKNGAIRRVFIDGRCKCPGGSIYVVGSQSCYNPTQKWSSKALLQCPDGQYALEGETSCKSCVDAEIYGISTAIACTIWKQGQAAIAKLRERGFTYATLVGNPQNPPNTLPADWYGSDNAPISPQWDDIFKGTSPVKYNMGEVAGHAPWGGDFASYTYNVDLQTWMLEANQMLQPTLIIPGFWYPCSSSNVKSENATCMCTHRVGAFDSEQSSSGSSNNQWHLIRIAAFEEGAKVLVENSLLADYAGGGATTAFADNSRIHRWSRFMILGSEYHSPSVCSRIGGKGPCFPVFKHIYSDIDPTSSNNDGSFDFEYMDASIFKDGWLADGIPTLKCSTGWPAHHMCPNGYTWVAPNVSSISLDNRIVKTMTSQIACLSCMPGSFSFLTQSKKMLTGGPYTCKRCVRGTFSSSVGSTSCTLCPSGTYASAPGATACSNCPPNYWTDEGAQTMQSCSPCPPGSGSCATCAAGHYQNMAAQGACIKCPRGYVSESSNLTTCTPCAPNTYQALSGMAFCETCLDGSYAMQEASTTCISCQNTPSCNLAVNGTCGVGCGLNYYYDFSLASMPGSGRCRRCPAGSINAFNPCAKDKIACSTTAIEKYALLVGPVVGDTILSCPLGAHPNQDKSGCIMCEPGTYASPLQKVGTCTPCQAGYYSSKQNQSLCDACPPGTFAPNKGQAGNCQSCALGKFSPTFASTICSECSPGYYANNQGSSLCTPCKNGTWSNETGKKSGCEDICVASEGWYSGSAATACRFCEGGFVEDSLSQISTCIGCGLGMYEKTNNITGIRECKQCDIGLVNLYEPFAPDASICQPCPSMIDYSPANLSGALCYTAPPGYVPTLPIKTGIVACVPGTYRSAQNTLCVKCPGGYVSQSPGQHECSICYPGTYSHVDGSTCVDCDLGLVSMEYGSTECYPCPVGSISTLFGSACTPCPANTYQFDMVQCKACDWGKTSITGSTACTPCPKWTLFDDITRMCVVCPAGTYMYDKGINHLYGCYPCPKGTQNPMSGANSSASCTKCSTGFIPTTVTSSSSSTFGIVGATGCTTCAAGQREINDTECEMCPAGSFSVRGIICTPCYTGTHASESGSSQCDFCSPGYYGNSTGNIECSKCMAGTFSNVSGSTSCITCNLAENGFAPMEGMTSCLPRKQRCSEGQYLLLQTHIPDKDNVCVDCVACAADEWAVTTQVEQWSSSVPPGACPGDATSPGYTCIKNVPEAGKFLAVKSLAGSTPYATKTGALFSVEGISCEDLPVDVSNLVDYVIGPTYECYLGCKYGVATAGSGFREYLNNYSMVLSNENPYNNIFFPRLASFNWASKICSVCPLTVCPLGKYRPEYSPGCGPPCGLPGYQQTCSTPTPNQGCIGTCASPPVGAIISGGASGLGNQSSCPWTCSYGYHLNEDETTGCTLCTVNICESGYVLVPADQCMTHHKKSDICKRCAIIEGGTAIGWNNQTQLCRYSCFTGYYSTFGASTCISCSFSPSVCGIGTYRDVESCYLKGIEPLCSSCSESSLQPGLISFTTHGGTSKNNCSGLCIAGYHTLLANVSSTTYISDTHGVGLPINQIKCAICKIDDTVPCHGKCQYGYFRNTSVTLDTTAGACVACTTNVQCGIGKFAPECSGNGTSDVGCHVCNQSILIQDGQVVREFVSYEVQQKFATTSIVYPSVPYACPSVCIANYVQASSGGYKCTSCKSYVQQKGCLAETKAPSAYAPLQPTPCDFIYSHWNATPDIVWWDYTPSFLPPSYVKNSAKKYNRGGFCWACPVGMGTLAGDPDLCMLLPGYGRPTLTPLTARVAIPTLDQDLYITFQEPRPFFATLVSSFQQGRRLLSSFSIPPPPDSQNITLPRYQNEKKTDLAISTKRNRNPAGASSSATTTSLGAVGMKCTYGWYKVGSGTGDCVACPFGTSTISEGSYDISQCLCSPGWYRTKSLSTSGNKNTTNNTLNNNNNNNNMACIPCEADTFRPAGTVGEEGCLRCPVNETTHGRKNSTRCSCIPGFVRSYKFDPPLCVPCEEGTYCQPCFDGQTNCPPEGVQITSCFSNSTSPPGSTSILNCTCLSGLAPFTTTATTTTSLSSPPYFYCAPVPPTAIYDQQNKKVGCKRGWTEQWSSSTTTGQQLLGCTLCELGYYAKNDPSLLSPPYTLTCLPCPKGSFAASKDVIGNCTQCLYPQTTLLDASTSPESCGCPPPTIKGPGGSCIGCLSNQYLLAGKCANCPAYSISSVGATSISDCLCMPGYGTIPEDVKKNCRICPVGQYSTAASNGKCKLCPIGSTTKGLGSKSIMECGATADLCLPGYTWRSANLGCAPTSSGSSLHL